MLVIYRVMQIQPQNNPRCVGHIPNDTPTWRGEFSDQRRSYHDLLLFRELWIFQYIYHNQFVLSMEFFVANASEVCDGSFRPGCVTGNI